MAQFNESKPSEFAPTLVFPPKSRVEKKTIYLRRENDHEHDTTEIHS